MSLLHHRFRTRHLPRHDGSCGWLATARPPGPMAGPLRRLSGDVEADAVVIGAGFSGLAAALPQPPRLPPDPFRSLGIRWRSGV